MNVKNSGLIKIPSFEDEDGGLFVLEAERQVPFPIQRAYFINIVNPNSLRGFHAHKKTFQAIFCLHGSFTLFLDDGSSTEEILMNNPSSGVLLGPMLWHTMTKFTTPTTILVLADRFYDASDYIRDYAKFIDFLRA